MFRSLIHIKLFSQWTGVIIWLLICCNIEVHGQDRKIGLDPEKNIKQFVIEQWTSKEGLPINSLTHALHSSNGFLWLSTYNGLIKFDGYQFEIYNKSNFPPFNNNGVHRTFEGRDGQIWICTSGSGLIRLDDQGYKVYNKQQGLPQSIRDGYADGDTIWVGSVNDGLYRIVNEEVEKINYQTVSGVTIFNIQKDPKGALWFSSDGKGITRYYKGEFSTMNQYGTQISSVQSLYCSKSGVNWIGTFEGLIKYENEQFELIDALAGNIVNDILEDDYGFFWMATNKGIARLNGATNEVEFLDEDSGLPGKEFNSITFDFENNLWFTSSRDGLLRFRSGEFTIYSKSQGLSSERVNAMLETDNGILVGTENGGVHVIKEDTVLQYALNTDLLKSRIRDLFIDDENNLWLSSYLGLLKVNNEGERLYTKDDGLPTNQMRGAVQDSNGILWIATRNAGVIKWKGLNDYSVIDKTNGINSNFIMSIRLDKQGRVVLSTNGGGVSIIDNSGVITNYGEKEGVLGNIIFSTYDDGDQLWVSTNSGVHIIKNGQVITSPPGAGLLGEAIFDILEDDNGGVWVTSSQGIIKVAKVEFLNFLTGITDNIQYRIFNENDGLINRECLGAVLSLKTEDGRLWVPTIDGLAMIDPVDLDESKVTLTPYITRFMVDNNEQTIKDDLMIMPGKKRYAFDFTSPTFVNSKEIKFKYFLENYDTEWNTTSGIDRNAQYTNLPYGKYVFSVSVADSHGQWSENTASMSFEIQPHFYQTLPFILVEVIVVISLIFGIYKWREGVVQREKRKLENTINERTTQIEQQKEEISTQRDTLEENLSFLKEAQGTISEQNARLTEYNEQLEVKVNDRTQELKVAIDDLIKTNEELDRFVYSAAHDLRGPVSRLLGMCNLARVDSEYLNSVLFQENLADTTLEMDQLIRRLISVNEVKNKKQKQEQVNLDEIIKRSFEQERDDNTKLQLNLEKVEYHSDAVLLNILFRNLFSNAVRYQDLNSQEKFINVESVVLDGQLTITVVDNGIGVDRSIGESIFDMFYKGVNHTKGFGLGLYESRIIVENLGGSIRWVDAQNTTFEIKIPL